MFRKKFLKTLVPQNYYVLNRKDDIRICEPCLVDLHFLNKRLDFKRLLYSRILGEKIYSLHLVALWKCRGKCKQNTNLSSCAFVQNQFLSYKW